MAKKKEVKMLNDDNKKVDHHTLDLDELIDRLNTSKDVGLDDEQVRKAMATHGTNKIVDPKSPSKLVKFAKELVGGFSLLLISGGMLCFASYFISYMDNKNSPKDNLFLGITLLTVVLVSAAFSFYQNTKSTKIMESFKKMIPQNSIVLRGGKKQLMSSEKLVVGDVIFLEGGDLIPADIRIIECNSFKVDNSSFTGESEPQECTTVCTNSNIAESRNIAFAFTYAIEGTCKGLVVSTGQNTLMGNIAYLTSSIKQDKTPIAKEIDKFIKRITIIAFMIGISFFILSITLAKTNVISAIVFLIGIIVANVPEGLLVTVTLTLTLTAKKIAKKNCLVKNLESVETLGSTSVICSDKTGTLTQNRMTVSHLWYDGKIVTVSTSEDTKRTSQKSDSAACNSLGLIAGLCNRAEFRADQDFSTSVLRLTTNGDASESALIKYVELNAGPLDEMRGKYKKVFEIPFNSTNKYQVSVHEQPDDERYLLVMKGAPERIVDRCSTILTNGQEEELGESYKKLFVSAYEEMGGMGERVLGFCLSYLPADKYPRGCPLSQDDQPTFSLEGLTFVGLVSMIDPPRAAVPHAVELCRGAGIKVVMVTGDHPITAVAIARNVGIVKGRIETLQEMRERINADGEVSAKKLEISAVITGNDIREMSTDEIDTVISLHKEIVFARTSPQQKLLIVEGFQRAGAVVAVTGDGVNDSPALRRADIGVAMGIAGSDVAKQAADMILLDDNFASIVTGVEEGRIIFDNLKKSIAYTLTSNIPEIAPFLAHILTGIPPPVGTITILCIDLGTDMVPAISLAYEKAETDIMKRRPRNPQKDSLVTSVLINYSYLIVGVLQALSGFVVYFYIMMDNGFGISHLRTYNDWSDQDVAFITDSFGQQWSYVARKDLEYTCHTAYFFSIVIVQWTDLIISKTRIMSLFKQGLFSNKMLIFGIFFETMLALLISYVPFLNSLMQTRPFHPKYLIPSFVFCYILWAFDEIRRFFVRANPNGLISRETYY